MRGVRLPSSPTRIKGRPVLVKRLQGLARAVRLFGEHRARERTDVLWAGKLYEQLRQALDDARGTGLEQQLTQKSAEAERGETRKEVARGDTQRVPPQPTSLTG